MKGHAPINIYKENKAQISYKGKIISTIVGKDYNKLKITIEMDNNYELRLFLVKTTEQFNHDTER